jgi:hypothetical protein
MKVTITSMQGNTRDISLMSKQEVLEFIKLYRSTLKKNQRVKVTCDLIGIDGYLQGTA